MPYFETDGIDLYYQCAGQGPALLFVHGLGMHSDAWEKQIDYFSAKYTVLAVDLRGHGRTVLDYRPVKFDNFAGDCAALLKHLEIGSAHVCGLSLGGKVALNLYTRYPELVDSLILADTVVNLPLETLNMGLSGRLQFVREHSMQEVGRAIAERSVQPGFSPEAVEQIAVMIASNDKDRYQQCITATVLGEENIDFTSGFEVPTLILCGQFDITTPIVYSQYIHEHILSSELVIVPDAAHLTNIEQPKFFNQTVDAFLKTKAIQPRKLKTSALTPFEIEREMLRF